MKERRERFADSMNATATHDHKRGEDSRARLAVLSVVAEEWSAATDRWFRLNTPIRPTTFCRDDEYQLYQTLVAAWPLYLGRQDVEALSIFEGRIAEWQQKALREAKLRTSWMAPNNDYERTARDFLAATLNPARSALFLQDLVAFVEQIAPAGAVNSLVQTVLKITLPGMPDFYQGTEFWDLSLVDPDNRRPVDFDARISSLTTSSNWQRLAGEWRGGHIKQHVIRKLSWLRREHRQFFREADYEPLQPQRESLRNSFSYRRRLFGDELVVTVPLHLNPRDIAVDLAVQASGWCEAMRKAERHAEAEGLADLISPDPVEAASLPFRLFGHFG